MNVKAEEIHIAMVETGKIRVFCVFHHRIIEYRRLIGTSLSSNPLL